MTIPAATVVDDTLKRDVAILSTLARLHCATVGQLHALCFPYHTLATARTTLFYLAEAHFIARSTWRVRGLSQERGQVWIVTAKGHDLLQRYSPHVPPLAHINLGRPSTSLEYEEWRVRITIRTLFVRLILEARRRPYLQTLEIQLPTSMNWASRYTQPPGLEPDAAISVLWNPPERRPDDWLPWLEAAPLPASAVCYPLFIERTHARSDLAEIVSSWITVSGASGHIPIVVLQDEGRHASSLAQVSALSQAPSIHLASSSVLEGLVGFAPRIEDHSRSCEFPLSSRDGVE